MGYRVGIRLGMRESTLKQRCQKYGVEWTPFHAMLLDGTLGDPKQSRSKPVRYAAGRHTLRLVSVREVMVTVVWFVA